MNALEIMKTFDENSLPDLDTAVLGALEFLGKNPVPTLDLEKFNKPLVVGSGNAAAVGELLFEHTDALFADEGTYEATMSFHPDIDAVIVISASGSKHAISIIRGVAAAGIPTYLITNNELAPAASLLTPEYVQVFPRMREPYTYNVSTYLGMLLANGGETAAAILSHIEQNVAPRIPDTFGGYDAFFLIVPPKFEAMKSMFTTKFDELFGPRVSARVFTMEQAKHAKTVVHSESECFISFGAENTLFGAPERRIEIPLANATGKAAMMAVGYFVIGNIQRQHLPHFKENIVAYTKRASEVFGQTITPIVE